MEAQMARRRGRDRCQIAQGRTMTGKPTVEELGIDVAAQRWRRSGDGDGAIEVAMVGWHGQPAPGEGPAGAGADWVLMRVAGDPSGRVLVYNRHEWECFLDGVRNGEFDDALTDGAPGREAPADGTDA
jgi:hypothetical protein